MSNNIIWCTAVLVLSSACFVGSAEAQFPKRPVKQTFRWLGNGHCHGYHWRTPGPDVSYYNPYSAYNSQLTTRESLGYEHYGYSDGGCLGCGSTSDYGFGDGGSNGYSHGHSGSFQYPAAPNQNYPAQLNGGQYGSGHQGSGQYSSPPIPSGYSDLGTRQHRGVIQGQVVPQRNAERRPNHDANERPLTLWD